MADRNAPPEVVFRVRVGPHQFTCRGHLVWEGGIVYAVAETTDDGPFVPEKVRIEESDLELRRDDERNCDWYQYHGFVVVPSY